MRKFLTMAALLGGGISTLLTSASPVAANGYWNVPSSACQWMGAGFGAGYHANFVLGPITCREMFDHREVRLPYAPSPPCTYQCGGYGYHHPSQLEGMVDAPLAPARMPTPTVDEPAAAPNAGESVPPMPVTATPTDPLPAPTQLQPAPIELPPAPTQPPVSTQPIFGAPVEP